LRLRRHSWGDPRGHQAQAAATATASTTAALMLVTVEMPPDTSLVVPSTDAERA
jgi:hypothetical protein